MERLGFRGDISRRDSLRRETRGDRLRNNIQTRRRMLDTAAANGDLLWMHDTSFHFAGRTIYRYGGGLRGPDTVDRSYRHVARSCSLVCSPFSLADDCVTVVAHLKTATSSAIQIFLCSSRFQPDCKWRSDTFQEEGKKSGEDGKKSEEGKKSDQNKHHSPLQSNLFREYEVCFFAISISSAVRQFPPEIIRLVAFFQSPCPCTSHLQFEAPPTKH